VLCVDNHADVVAELERLTSSAQAGAHSGATPGDPDLDPVQLHEDAQAAGDEAMAHEASQVEAPV